MDDARLHRVAQVDAGLVEAVRIEDAGDAGAIDLLQVAGGDDGRESLPAVKEQLVVGTRLVEADVAVRIDEARHHGQAGGIDTFDAVDFRRRTLAHGDDPVAGHDHVAQPGRVSQSVDDPPVLDDQCGSFGRHEAGLHRCSSVESGPLVRKQVQRCRCLPHL